MSAVGLSRREDGTYFPRTNAPGMNQTIVLYLKIIIMADLKSVLALSLSGRIQDKIFRKLRNGKTIVSQQPSEQTFSSPEVKEDRDTRITGFGGSGHIIPVVMDAIRLGFRDHENWEQPGNYFMKANAKTLCDAVRDERGDLKRVYDFKEMVVSAGPTIPIVVTVSVTPDTGKILFEQEADTSVAGANRGPKDVAYALVLESGLEEAGLVQLRERSESGSTSFAIPASWDKTKLFIHVFTTSAYDKKSSKSSCLYPANNELNDALVTVEVLEEDIVDATDGKDLPESPGVEVMIEFTKWSQRRKTSRTHPRDRVYAILLNTVGNRYRCIPLGTRVGKKKVKVTLDKDWDPMHTYLYSFTVDHDYKRVSVPVCLNAGDNIAVPRVAVNAAAGSLAFAVDTTPEPEPVTRVVDGEEVTDIDTLATAGIDPDVPAEHLYTAVFDAAARHLDLVPVHATDAAAPATLAVAEGSNPRYRFTFTIAVTGDGRSRARRTY